MTAAEIAASFCAASFAPVLHQLRRLCRLHPSKITALCATKALNSVFDGQTKLLARSRRNPFATPPARIASYLFCTWKKCCTALALASAVLFVDVILPWIFTLR